MSGTPGRVFDALDAEWVLVCAGPGNAATVHGWLQDGGVFSDQEAVVGLEDVLPELERRDRVYGRSHSDRWLYALLCEAVGEGAGAQLAARVVVQAMLPGAVRLTRRLRAGRDFDETGQVVASCLYRVVRTYPLSRRHRVAANLVLETLHWASRELAAEAESGGVSWHPGFESAGVVDEPVSADDPAEAAWSGVLARRAAEIGLGREGSEQLAGARGELVELLVWAVGAGHLDAERARVIVAEVRAGARVSAEAAGVSAVAWRQRRSRTVRQLRAVAEQWVQAA